MPESDVAFLREMLAHHNAALTMAKAYLADTSPRTRPRARSATRACAAGKPAGGPAHSGMG